MRADSSDNITIREARPKDREQILAFTRHTFRWGDYLDQTWDRWRRERTGKLIVAEIGGRVVGNLHLAILGEGEAWVEGMRVHPDFRRRGISTLMDRRAVKYAREAGCQVIRLETGSSNYAAQAAIVSLGYRYVMSLREWEAPSTKGSPQNIRPAGVRDLPSLMILREHSWIRLATRSLFPLSDPWHWGNFSMSRLAGAVRHGRVWLITAKGKTAGFVVLGDEEEALQAIFLAGRQREAVKMLAELHFLARVQGRRKCHLVLPDQPRIEEWALSSGFADERGGLQLYGKLI
jgi:ribosomal protein S18 acetylase RimI-like enzyme